VSSNLTYGMTIGTFNPQNRGTTLANATDQLIEYLRLSNANIRMVRTVGRIQVDGAEALVVDFTNDSPVAANQPHSVVTVLSPDGLLRYFLGVAPELEFRNYRPVFDRIVASVRLLD